MTLFQICIEKCLTKKKESISQGKKKTARKESADTKPKSDFMIQGHKSHYFYNLEYCHTNTHTLIHSHTATSIKEHIKRNEHPFYICAVPHFLCIKHFYPFYNVEHNYSLAILAQLYKAIKMEESN